MKHFASNRFWKCYDKLPIEIQQLAKHHYKLLKENPQYPSLHFKEIYPNRYWSVRIGLHYRALGISVPDGIQWFWIGSHEDYNKFAKS